MNGYERRKAKKIGQIYEAAFRMFAEYGYPKVSVHEIAQSAQVSPATIYNYFGTKEQLYAEMLIDWMDKQLEQYEAILSSELPFIRKTREIMLRESRNLKLLTEQMAEAHAAERGEWRQRLETYSEEKAKAFYLRYVELGKREGYIRQSQSEEGAIAYFMMFMNELSRYWEEGQSANELEGRIDALLELFFYGLVGQESRTL